MGCRSSSSSRRRRPTTAPGYLGNLARARRVAAPLPGAPVPAGHGAAGRTFRRVRRMGIPRRVLAAYKRDNLQIEVMFPITWGGVWDYPYPEAQAADPRHARPVRRGKLVWGSDMPNVERFCTYRQCVDYVRRLLLVPHRRAKRTASSAGNAAELHACSRPDWKTCPTGSASTSAAPSRTSYS